MAQSDVFESLSLIEHHSDADERYIIRHASLIRHFVGPFVVSGSDDARRVDRLDSILQANGYTVNRKSTDHVRQILRAGLIDNPTIRPARLTAEQDILRVISITPLAKRTKGLIEAMTGTPIIDGSGILTGGALPFRAAMIIADPEKGTCRDFFDLLAELHERDIRVGLVFTLSGEDACFIVAKTLYSKINHQANKEYGTVLSYPHGRGIISAEWEAKRTPTAVGSFVVISGHANALDATATDSVIVCSRSASVTPNESWSLFPCFFDGRCFRKRGPLQNAELRSITDFNAAVLGLTGCNTIAIGSGWFNVRNSLAYQAMYSTPAAVVACGSAVRLCLEIDLLWLALAWEGLSLGEIVSRVNKCYAELFPETLPFPAGVGPYFLLGNPELTMPHGRIRTLRGFPKAAPRHTTVKVPTTVKIPVTHLHSDSLAIFSTPVSKEYNYFAADFDQGDHAVAGISVASGCERVLYVFVLPSGARFPKVIRLDLLTEDPYRRVSQMLTEFCRELPFWRTFLRESANQLKAQHFDVSNNLVASSAVETAEQTLPKLAKMLPLRRRVFSNTRPKREVAERSQVLVSGFSSSLLRAAEEISWQLGTVFVYEWIPYFEELNEALPRRPCQCGKGIVSAQSYFSAVLGCYRRYSYQCSSCGPAGEGSYDSAVRILTVSASAEVGSEVVWTLMIDSPDLVLVHCLGVLEDRHHERKIVGEASETWVEADESKLTVSVTVPPDLTPGVYSVSIIAIINGSLIVGRNPVTITPATSFGKKAGQLKARQLC